MQSAAPWHSESAPLLPLAAPGRAAHPSSQPPFAAAPRRARVVVQASPRHWQPSLPGSLAWPSSPSSPSSPRMPASPSSPSSPLSPTPSSPSSPQYLALTAFGSRSASKLAPPPNLEAATSAAGFREAAAKAAKSPDSARLESSPRLKPRGSCFSSLHPWHNPTSADYVPPSRWCVTWNQLQEFEDFVRKKWDNGYGFEADPRQPRGFHEDPSIGPTIHQVNEYCIKPETLDGRSWALTKNPRGEDENGNPTECDVFATHCWSEGVFEFCTKVKRAWPSGAKYLWACFLANPQNGNIPALLDDITTSPFAEAMKTAKYLLVVPNTHVSIYSRLWCVYEAHLAVNVEVAKRGMQVRLPVKPPRGRLAQNLVPGLVMMICSSMFGFYFVAPSVSYLLEPMLWVFLAIITTRLLDWCGKLLLRRRRRKASLHVFLCWLELSLLGFGFGIARYDLRGLANHLVFEWEPGEGWACTFLIASCVMMYMREISMVIIRAVTMREGLKLRFRTVREAECSVSADAERIRQAIRGHEEKIDKAIRVLSTIGHYDREVQYNMDHGMSPSRMRDGMGPFRVITACCAWSYWWVTDLSAHMLHVFATVAMIATCALALAVVYGIGERSICFIDSLLFFGLAFVVTSIFISRFVWGDEPIRDMNMSIHTLWLQLLFFSLMIVANVCYYSGLLATVWASFCPSSSDEDSEDEFCGVGCVADGGDRHLELQPEDAEEHIGLRTVLEAVCFAWESDVPAARRGAEVSVQGESGSDSEDVGMSEPPIGIL